MSIFDPFIENIRLYLLSIGFNQKGANGTIYFYECFIKNNDIRMRAPVSFVVDFNDETITASFPDYEYNAKNPTSPKTSVVHMDLVKDHNCRDYETACHNIEQFITNIVNMNKF